MPDSPTIHVVVHPAARPRASPAGSGGRAPPQSRPPPELHDTRRPVPVAGIPPPRDGAVINRHGGRVALDRRQRLRAPAAHRRGANADPTTLSPFPGVDP
jgi:hypothetical protein